MKPTYPPHLVLGVAVVPLLVAVVDRPGEQDDVPALLAEQLVSVQVAEVLLEHLGLVGADAATNDSSYFFFLERS